MLRGIRPGPVDGARSPAGPKQNRRKERVKIIGELRRQEAPGELCAPFNHKSHNAARGEQPQCGGNVYPPFRGVPGPKNMSSHVQQVALRIFRRIFSTDDHNRAFACVLNEGGRNGGAKLGIEHDAERIGPGGVAYGEARVVRQQGADADGDAVVSGAECVNFCTSVGAGDPFRRAGAGRNTPIER